MDKLTMAHEYLLRYSGTTVAEAWQYADAMQAEAEKREPKGFPEAIEEWQPDWSQAPDWAKWWAMDGFGNKKAHWYRDKPYLDDDSLIEDEWNTVLYSQKYSFAKAPSFNYQGDWKDSIRERPSND